MIGVDCGCDITLCECTVPFSKTKLYMVGPVDTGIIPKDEKRYAL